MRVVSACGLAGVLGAGMEALSASDPRQVREFQLRARLGVGGMGRVYLGYSPAGRAVAIKVVHPELARDAEFRSGSATRWPPRERSAECIPRPSSPRGWTTT